jgi:predicted ATPase
MELLERDAVLAQLSEALGRAATGRGLVVAISGEAGIGKTSVVRRFVAERDGDARVLWGACDDLAVPRPLGPFGTSPTPATAGSPRRDRAQLRSPTGWPQFWSHPSTPTARRSWRRLLPVFSSPP